VVLQPASVYYVAYWADVALFIAGGSNFNALCYYGLQYGYDLQPWPASIGSVEAKYYNCNPLPVAALGCTTSGSPPNIPPACPATEEKTSITVIGAAVVLTAIVTALLTLLCVKLYLSGKCSGGLFKRSSSNGIDDDVRSSRTALHGSDAAESTSGSRYSALSD